MNMKLKYFLVGMLIICMFVSTQDVFAGGRKLGTAGAVELLIPMGAQSVGMGGANLANVSNTEAIYWNPAGLAKLTKAEATFSYMTYFADMSVSYVTAGFNAGRIGNFGLTLQSFDVGEIDVTTIDSPEGTGEIIKPDYMTITASYGKLLTDRIMFGANTKSVSERIGSMSASAVAFDFGLQYRSDHNIDFGVTLRNLGSRIQFSGTGIEFDSAIPFANPNATTRKTQLDMGRHELPTSLNIGLAYRYNLNEEQKLNVTGIFANNGYALDQIIGGIEYSYRDFVFLRGGYDAPMFPSDYPEDAKDDYQYGLHFGAGVVLNVGGSVVKFNYAYRDMQLFDANNYFTIGFEF
jgi:hypothetical protein